MQVTPTCDLDCMTVTLQQLFPRKKALANYYNTDSPSLPKKKKLTWKSLLREMTGIYLTTSCEAELSPTRCSHSCAKQVPFRLFETEKHIIFINCSYLKAVSYSELKLLKNSDLAYTQILKCVQTLAMGQSRLQTFSLTVWFEDNDLLQNSNDCRGKAISLMLILKFCLCLMSK